MKSRICHITTVHNRYDDRIFLKECISLTKEYEVFLVVADGKGNEIKENVNIIDIGLRQSSRLKRAKIDSKKALNKAKELNCELYHFHDPELLTITAKLKKRSKKVIYDVHEDLPRQIYGKPYLSRLAKPILSHSIEFYENRIAKKTDYIFTATPFIRKRFEKLNKQCIDINNYPILTENTTTPDYSSRENSICYVGGLAESRGVFELIDSLRYSQIKLHLAGNFDDDEFKKKCMQSQGWKYVNYHGFVSRKAVAEILNRSKIGMVSLHPLVNYLDSLPVKMFEYMLAEIPVIASNFPYWIKIIDDNKCGININPLDAKEIAKAVEKLLNDDDQAKQMGKSGRKAVISKFNWLIEEKKMLKIYQSLLK